MRMYGLVSIVAAFLAAQSYAHANPVSPEKDMLIDSYEGFAPEITRYAIEGRFDEKRPFGVEIARQGGHWTIRFRYVGNEAEAFTLPFKNYPSLHFEKIFVVTRSPSFADPHVMVVIPFGEPLSECFLNGEDVFRQVILGYDAGKLTSVEERVFKDCDEEWRQLPLDGSRDD